MDKIAIKAGMGNIDRARVESIIDRMTRNRVDHTPLLNSPMAQKEQRDLAKHRIKTSHIRAQIDQAHANDKNQKAELVEGLLRGIRAQQCFDRLIVHVDMDMYFAACEELNDPSLKSFFGD